MSRIRLTSTLTVAVLCLITACRRGEGEAGARQDPSAPVAAAGAAGEPAGTGDRAGDRAVEDSTASRRPAATPAPAADENAVENLVQEEREANPRSEKVKIVLVVEPAQVRAKVFWGIKCLGTAPLELERPRQSGPMDLVLEAPGYLRYHTRVFTDRDDKLTVHMVPASAGSHVFGYRPSASASAEKAPENRKK